MQVRIWINKSKVLVVICLMLCGKFGFSQVDEIAWIDSLMNTMTEDQKLGQLFMIRAYGKQDAAHIKKVKQLIRKEHVGGLCFLGGSPEKQAELTNQYQEMSDLPLLIAIDGEWGLGMRFKEKGFSFPRQLMLGAIKGEELIYKMGREIADHCKMMGIHVNFAPVIDVNNNPLNPVINNRSFGEDMYNVAAKGFAYATGMEDAGILACAKHFPGHGDTDVDSHKDLPVINHTRDRIDSLELMPFRELSREGISSMMVAHLNIPSIDDRPNRPSTLSKNNVTQILKHELGFNGLIFTDALDMKGVTKHFETGEVEAEALIAGNDVLLIPEDVPKAKEVIKKYISEGKISWSRIDLSVRKILTAKIKAGLHLGVEPIENIETLEARFKSIRAQKLNYELVKKAMTLVRNDDQLIPFNLNTASFGTLAIGTQKMTKFQSTLAHFESMKHINIAHNIGTSVHEATIRSLKDVEVVFVSVHDMSKYAQRDFGLKKSTLDLIDELSKSKKVILTLFGSPYATKFFEDMPSLLVAYEDNDVTQDVAAQALMGVHPISGSLPVTACKTYPLGTGVYTKALMKLGYAKPEHLGLSGDSLEKIDDIVEEMITEKAAPGCQVLVAKEGKIVWHKSYGYHTYKKKRKTKLTDLFDVASITKILATTLSIMKLQEEGYLDLNSAIGDCAPLSDNPLSNKKDIVVKEILAHHAGLPGWIPFYEKTISDDKKPRPLDSFYRAKKEQGYGIEVARKLFLRNDYRDSIYLRVDTCGLRETKDYRYSDVGFYMLDRLILEKTKQDIGQFATASFYRPLGLNKTTFSPKENGHSHYNIVPTEEDTYFRNQRIQGYVHDMGAAMLGGVAGHAGLFSTSYELGILMQMLLNGGIYDGIKYFEKETIEEYTQRFERSSRRGLGFDMKELDTDKTLNMSEKASDSTFGHLGFTGAAAFADPEHDLVYIFLSNRTYPSMENKKFGRKNYRPRIQSAIYNAMVE